MPTVFTRIIAGELPGHFVWSDERVVGFLSINPTQPGHALVVPRAEVDHWLDLEPATAARCMEVAQAIGRAQQRAFSPARVGLLVAGFEVPHVHLHVIPVRGMMDLDLANSARDPDPAGLEDAALRIRSELEQLGYAQVSAKP